MSGAAFASGPALNVSMRFQARSKAGAVEGDRSLVIEFSDDNDRSIGMSFRVVVARLETEQAGDSDVAPGLQALLTIGGAHHGSSPPLDRRTRFSRTSQVYVAVWENLIQSLASAS